jgi:aerobic carbon-monoxide dehydrogenase large subunit
MSATGIGAAVRRKKDFRFVRGQGQYTADISRPGEAYLAFVRSPHAHAKIAAVDTKAAQAMPGVLAVRPCRKSIAATRPRVM